MMQVSWNRSSSHEQSRYLMLRTDKPMPGELGKHWQSDSNI